MTRGCNDCGVGPGVLVSSLECATPVRQPRRTAPASANRWGAKAEPPVYVWAGGFAVRLVLTSHADSKCVMGRGVDWSRIASRNRMRRQGVEDVKGGTHRRATCEQKAASPTNQSRTS
jgi:hypothetical protein